MIKLRTYFLLSAILLPQIGAVAQPRPINKEVEVKRPYDPSVVDAQKIWFDPTINVDSLKAKDPIRYSVMPQSISSDFGLNPIASATFIENNRGNSGLGYVRVGAGYLPSTLADFYISNNNASTVLLGLYANHRGFWGDIELDNGNMKKDVNADNMSNDIGAFIKVPFSSAILSINADYSGKRFRFYGYDPSWFAGSQEPYKKDSVRQTFNLYNINVQVESATSGGDRFDYGGGFSVQRFTDRFDMGETAFMGWAMLGKHWDGMHNLSGTIRVANYNRNNKLDNFGSNTLLYVQPSYTYTNGDFTGKLGLSFVGDQYDGDSDSKVYPALMASYRLADFFIPSVEIRGDTEVNSYRKLAYDCNYVRPGLDNSLNYIPVTQKFRNTYRDFVAQFSVKGDIGSMASYNFYVSYSKIDNLPFFINEDLFTPLPPLFIPLFTNNLGVIYDDGNLVNVGGELRLDTKSFSLYAKAVYNKYDMDNLTYAVHRPKFETDIRASLKLDNFIISANLNMGFKRYYIRTLGAQISLVPDYHYHELGDIINLSGSVEYFITDKFSVFGNINNLLNKKYEVFHQHRVPGMMLSGGITFRF
ncbi:MAG: hypothetical protein LBG19_03045 [Prevotellaceae bacterium]|jgi:hypothetical protein|nr:hypothetical protein [Prevotellaceae bacterium]